MKNFILTILFVVSFITTYSQNYFSEHGKAFTPTGDLKVLTVFVSFSNFDTVDNPEWGAMQDIPAYAQNNKFLFQDISNFDTVSEDNKSVSNYFYQMSNHQLKLYSEYLPIKITLPNEKISIGGKTMRYIIYDSLKSAYDINPTFFHSFDIRNNPPRYLFQQVDSSDGIIDFVFFIYRYFDNPAIDTFLFKPNDNGNTPTDVNTTLYSISDDLEIREGLSININTGTSFSKALIHELGHAIFNDCHYGGANAVNYPNLHTTKMGGMIPSMTCEVYSGANAWERWYLGWIDIKHDLTENDPNGIYELDDYFTTGDAIRIKLPNSNQYLWLENHQGKTIFDNRIDYTTHICGSDTLPSSPRGLLIYTENITDDKSTGDVLDKANGIKLLHSKGNYDIDTCGWVQTTDWSILCNNKTPKFKLKKPNPYSGYSKISHHYLDYNMSGIIDYNPGRNGGSNECYEITILNDSLISGDTAFNVIYGNFGSDCAFQVGDSIGIATNPPITNLQKYTLSKRLLSPIFLEGVSIKIISQDSTGKMRIRINFDDYDINNDIRMCGDIVFPPNKININAKIDIDKSNTINRTKKDTTLNIIDFINPSIVKTQKGTELVINDNSRITVKNKSILLIDDSSSLTINNGGILQIDSGACLIVKKDANIDIKNYGRLVINDGAYVCISPSSNINLNTYGILSLSENVNATATDYARYRNLENNHCTSLDSLNIIGCGFIGNIATMETLDSIVIWNTEKIIAQNLTIDSGQTLRIENTTLSVAANKGIVIKAGGKIVVNNSEITNYKKSCLYNDYWNGIRLEGNKNLPQTESNQGVVELNNALISDAKDAISVIGENSDWNKTGGIIKAKNTTFKNNRRSIEFMSYGEGSNVNNVSYFRNCTFTWDDDLLANESTVQAHITMYQVRGVEVLGCTFKDERTSTTGLTTHGILTNQAGFIVNNYLLLPGHGGTAVYKNTSFENLTYGIRTEEADDKLCKVENSVFDENDKGIYVTNTDNLYVVNNTFNVKSISHGMGLVAQNSTNFTIQKNDFLGTSNTNNFLATSGLQIVSSGADNNLIKQNRFVNLYSGFQALGVNYGINTGLELNCNSFASCQRGIDIPAFPLNNVTGIKSVQGSQSLSAGNKFINNTNNVINNGVNTITYYYYGSIENPNYTSMKFLPIQASAGASCGLIGNITEPNFPLLSNGDGEENEEEGSIETLNTAPATVLSYINKKDYLSAENLLSTSDMSQEEKDDYRLYSSYIQEYGNSYNIPTNILLDLSEKEGNIGLVAKQMLYFKGVEADLHPKVIVEQTQDSDTTAITNKMKSVKVLNGLSQNDEYTLSPNPANSEVVVKGAKEIREITILDLQGKELKSFYNTEKFNISFLKNGTYIVRILDSENKVHYQKLVKQ